MKTPKQLIAFLFFWYAASYAQQTITNTTPKKIALSSVLASLEKQQELHFSFDADAIQKIQITTAQTVSSLAMLRTILQNQTPYTLEKVSSNEYLLIKDTTLLSLCGVVVDAASGFELPSATIETETHGSIDTETNGTFDIQVHPRETITVSFLGYTPIVLKATDLVEHPCTTIRLSSKALLLDQVVVKEYLTKGIQKNSDGSIDISTKELRILPGLAEPDVLQSLQMIPGISSPTEDPAGLYIRGGTPSQNLILWDGIKMYHTGHFFNQISTFNPFIVKKIKTYKGGTSVRYGDRIAGIIAIESDDDLTDKLQVGGGINLTHADAFAKIPLSSKVGVLLAGRRSTTDWYQNINYENLVRKVFQSTRADFADRSGNSFTEIGREDAFHFSDINAKIIWQPNATNFFRVSSIYAENKLDNIQNITLQDSNDRTLFINLIDKLTLENTGWSLYWKKKYASGIEQETSFYASSYNRQYRLEVDRSVSNSSIMTVNEIKDIGGEFSLQIPVDTKNKVRLGYQFTYNDSFYNLTHLEIINRKELTNDTRKLANVGTNHTVFSEYVYTSARSNLSIGLRSYILSNTDQVLTEPRLFASTELWKNFRLTTSAELKNQQLNNYTVFNNDLSSDVASLPAANDVWFISSNDSSKDSAPILPIVKSQQFTLGSLYTYRGWNLDIEGYYKKITDIPAINDVILRIAAPFNIDSRANTSGTEHRIGIDLLIKKRIRNYRFWLGYTLSNSNFSFPTIQKESFDGNFDQRHVFNFSQTLKIKKLEFALGWNYASGRPFSQVARSEVPVNNALGVIIKPNTSINSNRYRDYHRLDASVTYRFLLGPQKKWKAMLGASARNIYDRANDIDQAYIGNNEAIERTDNTFVNTVNKQSLRFTPDIVFRIQF